MTTPEATTTTQTTRSPRRAVFLVVAVVFVDLLGFGIIVPILPFYVRSFGVSDVFIGLLAASYSLAQFLAAPTLGRISDERGRRPVLLFSVAIAGVAWVVFGVAAEVQTVAGTTVALAMLFGARLLSGAAGGNVAAAQAYIADVTPPEDRAGALGLVGAAFALGFVFGPALGGVVASDAVVTAARAVFPAVVPATKFSLPSFVAAGLSFLAFGIGAIVLKEPDRERTPARKVTFVAQFRAALADAALRPLVISFFVVSLSFAGVQVMFVPFVADFFGYGATQAALFLTYIGVLGVVNQGVLIGRLAERFGARRVVFAGSGSLAAALLLLAASPVVAGVLPPVGRPSWLTGGLLMLLAFGALASFGNGSLTVGLSTLVSERTSANTQGTAFGVTQAAGSLGRTVGPPLAAAAYVLVYWSPFLAGAMLLSVVVWTMWRAV